MMENDLAKRHSRHNKKGKLLPGFGSNKKTSTGQAHAFKHPNCDWLPDKKM